MIDDTKVPTRADNAMLPMKDTIKERDDVLKIEQRLGQSTGYMITYTVVLSDGSMEHHFETNNFKTLSLLNAHMKCKDLVVTEIEKKEEKS